MASLTYEELALKDIIDATTYNNSINCDEPNDVFEASVGSNQRDFYLARAQVYATLFASDPTRHPSLDNITINDETTSDLDMFTNFDMN